MLKKYKYNYLLLILLTIPIFINVSFFNLEYIEKQNVLKYLVFIPTIFLLFNICVFRNILFFVFYLLFYIVYIFYYITYQDEPNLSLFLSIFNANSSELKFLLTLYPLQFLSMLLINCLIIYTFTKSIAFNFYKRTMKYLFYSITFIIILIGFNLDNKVFPFNNLYQAYQALDLFNYPSSQTPVTVNNTDKKLVLLIIGESVRQDIFIQVNNENKVFDKNYQIFSNNYAQANGTYLSVPSLLTGFTHPANNKPSWFDLMGKNCHSEAISSNLPTKQYENADFFYKEPESMDSNLLPIVESRIKKLNPNVNNCMIIHSVGSHFDYIKRYNQVEEKYPVDRIIYNSFKIKPYQKKTEIINAYKNSILQTQLFIKDIVDQLDLNYKGEYLLIYVSDHGENLFEYNDSYFLHMMPAATTVEMMTPLMFKFSNKNNYLFKNTKAKTTNEFVLPTILTYFEANNIPPYMNNGLFVPIQNKKIMYLNAKNKLDLIENLIIIK